MTAGMLVFASLISNINNVINDGSLIKFEEKMEALDEFFKHRRLPADLLERVRQYHEKIFEMSHGISNFNLSN
jgi:dsDNA-specific endonuclease/ATPase MutS2